MDKREQRQREFCGDERAYKLWLDEFEQFRDAPAYVSAQAFASFLSTAPLYMHKACRGERAERIRAWREKAREEDKSNGVPAV